jgi:hypothetical protein
MFDKLMGGWFEEFQFARFERMLESRPELESRMVMRLLPASVSSVTSRVLMMAEVVTIRFERFALDALTSVTSSFQDSMFDATRFEARMFEA